MRIFKLCPSGHKHIWFRRYCYHESKKVMICDDDGIYSHTNAKNTWDFKEQRYLTKLYAVDEGAS